MEVYDFLFLWNPNGMLAMNHPPIQILVLGFKKSTKYWTIPKSVGTI